MISLGGSPRVLVSCLSDDGDRDMVRRQSLPLKKVLTPPESRGSWREELAVVKFGWSSRRKERLGEQIGRDMHQDML